MSDQLYQTDRHELVFVGALLELIGPRLGQYLVFRMTGNWKKTILPLPSNDVANSVEWKVGVTEWVVVAKPTVQGAEFPAEITNLAQRKKDTVTQNKLSLRQ